MILTQFSFLFLSFFSFGGKKKPQNQSFFSHFVTAGYQSISIHGTVMIAHVVRGPNLIGLHFSAVFHMKGKKKKSIFMVETVSTRCTTVINQTWQQWLHLYKSETGRFRYQNHPISVKISSAVIFFNLFYFSSCF